MDQDLKLYDIDILQGRGGQGLGSIAITEVRWYIRAAASSGLLTS